MRRYFNTEGRCNPRIHYMVKLDERLKIIRQRYVERGSYFVINRGRQYGKTTTLRLLGEYLEDEYIVLSMDFQEIGSEEFRSEKAFSYAFSKMLIRIFDSIRAENKEELIRPVIHFIEEANEGTLRELFVRLSDLCEKSPKPVILMIDEVDSAANNQVFLDFLALLRRYYLDRENSPTFHSVILAGVYDIKNLKLKLRDDEEHKYNSPWNIAAVFDIDMNFSVHQIAAMLEEYEADHRTKMNVNGAAEEIYQYTEGYPYLVSAICKILDENLSDSVILSNPGDVWSKAGIAEAVKIILDGQIPLFQSMIRQLSEYPDLKQMLNVLLFQGKRMTFNPDNPVISLAAMFGYIVNKERCIQIANRIFEMRLYNYFLSEEELTNAIYNEAQTRDARRTDVIVDYLGEQFIIELKIWHGGEFNERGEEQLIDYLNYYHQDKGYLLSFNFNKKKEQGIKELQIGSKTIIEAVV